MERTLLVGAAGWKTEAVAIQRPGWKDCTDSILVLLWNARMFRTGRSGWIF